jgi:hypothetical protein
MSIYARFFDSPAISWGLFCALFGISPILLVFPASK